MALSIRRSAVLVAVAAIVCLGLYGVLRTWKLVGDSLNDESARLKNRHEVAFELTDLTPHETQYVKLIQTITDTRALAMFNGSVYAATGGGLAVYSADGELQKRYSVLDGLPESDLTAIGVFRETLFIGTRTKGIVAFDGESFRLYRFTDRKALAIGAFASTAGELLIGTFDGGLISFDGSRFFEITPGDARIKGIISISADDSEALVGTYADGLWIRQGAAWKRFTTADGLPSNRVVDAFRHRKKIYAATDLGLASLDGERFVPVARQANVTSAAAFGDSIIMTNESGGVFSVERRVSEIAAAPAGTRNARLSVAGDSVLLVSDGGIRVFEGNRLKAFADVDENGLTSNFVSAVAVDRDGTLWVGSFRNGLDVLNDEGRRLAHIESPDVREINFIGGEPIRVASSKGLFGFGPMFKPTSLIAADKLASRSVTHFSGSFIATAKGLAQDVKNDFRILTAGNGLPSNSTYAALGSGERTFVGTLGGLAEIVSGRVERVYKDSNSNLDTNWVTALAEVRGRIFIGTYGGGVFELLPSGEIRSFRAETGKFVVNPNALATDGRRLFAGTLDGLRVLDLETQQWQRITDILPSATVMSIAADGDSIIVGTTGGVARIETKYFGTL